MGILARIRVVSPRTKVLERLAIVAGKQEELAQRLQRHAQICEYTNIKTGLERLSASQAAQARVLRRLLTEQGWWPRPPDPAPEGGNNWQRLSADLSLMVESCRAFNLLAVEAGSVESALAEKLRGIAAVLDHDAGELRDLTLKCDPQALD